MTCSLVLMQSSTYAAIVACSTECNTNNASHHYSYCKRRKLRWKTGYEATLLHSCLWFPGNFPTELIIKKKNRPTASKVGKVLPEKQSIFLPWPYSQVFPLTPAPYTGSWEGLGMRLLSGVLCSPSHAT